MLCSFSLQEFNHQESRKWLQRGWTQQQQIHQTLVRFYTSALFVLYVLLSGVFSFFVSKPTLNVKADDSINIPNMHLFFSYCFQEIYIDHYSDWRISTDISRLNQAQMQWIPYLTGEQLNDFLKKWAGLTLSTQSIIAGLVSRGEGAQKDLAICFLTHITRSSIWEWVVTCSCP